MDGTVSPSSADRQEPERNEDPPATRLELLHHEFKSDVDYDIKRINDRARQLRGRVNDIDKILKRRKTESEEYQNVYKQSWDIFLCMKDDDHGKAYAKENIFEPLMSKDTTIEQKIFLAGQLKYFRTQRLEMGYKTMRRLDFLQFGDSM